MVSRSGRLRRAASIVAYWRKGRFVLENYLTSITIATEPIALTILHHFETWRTVLQFRSMMPQFTPASVESAVEQLHKCTFLVGEGSPEAARDERFEKIWRDWLPSAGFFHFSTKDVPYSSDLQRTRKSLQQRAQQVSVPPPIKQYPGHPHLPLPAPRTDGEFAQVLLSRRTWRRFSRKPIELADMASLLWLTFGVQHWVELPGIGRVALKTAPSAGARHPVEVYVQALRVTGLRKGLYHYRPDEHKLELLKRGVDTSRLVNHLAKQQWYASAAAVAFLTAVFPRNQWKYRDPGAYRTVLLDAGHLCQTFCLASTWLGLAPFCTGAVAESEVEKCLGLDGISESVIYVAGVGQRPSDVDWAPWPTKSGAGTDLNLERIATEVYSRSHQPAGKTSSSRV